MVFLLINAIYYYYYYHHHYYYDHYVTMLALLRRQPSSRPLPSASLHAGHDGLITETYQRIS